MELSSNQQQTVIAAGDILNFDTLGQSFRLQSKTGAFNLKFENNQDTGSQQIRYVAAKSGILETNQIGGGKSKQKSTGQTRQRLEVDIIPLNSNRYTPQENDVVIGTVIQKSPEFFTIDINSESYAQLSTLEFQNSTRKDRPQYPEGTLIYCRVLRCEKFSKPQLSCISLTHKKAWNSGEAYFGNLTEGFVKDFPIAFCRQLLANSSSEGILDKLGERIQYDINIGYNGKIWVKTAKIQETIFIFQALERILESGHTQENIQFVMKALVGQ
eukprot:403349194